MSARTPITAIRHKCLDCCCGSVKAVRWCSATDCTLWPYRFGMRPETARKRYGDRLVDPDKMPNHLVMLESLR